MTRNQKLSAGPALVDGIPGHFGQADIAQVVGTSVVMIRRKWADTTSALSVLGIEIGYPHTHMCMCSCNTCGWILECCLARAPLPPTSSPYFPPPGLKNGMTALRVFPW